MLPLNNPQTPGVYPQIATAVPSEQKGGAAYAKVIEMLMIFVSKWYWFL
jgi:hypothetical protein